MGDFGSIDVPKTLYNKHKCQGNNIFHYASTRKTMVAAQTETINQSMAGHCNQLVSW
jgi:hypothetical protein